MYNGPDGMIDATLCTARGKAGLSHINRAEAEPAVPGWTMPVDELFE
jgi:hypothetical protein